MIELDKDNVRLPVAGESLYGYLAQMVADNGLDRVALLSGESDRDHGHRPHLMTTAQDELTGIATTLGIDLAELELRSHLVLQGDPGRRAFFGTTIARADLRQRVRFFSPAALATEPHHRALWLLRIPFDTETGEILISDCGLCGRTQRWRHTAGVAYCDGCGDSLIRPVTRICDVLLPEVALAVGLTDPDPDKRAASLALLPCEIAALGPASAYELLLRLIPVMEPSCGWTSADRVWRNDPRLIAAGMQKAWIVLVGWPRSMTDRISLDLAISEIRHTDGNGGATMRFLQLQHLSYLPEQLRNVVQRLHHVIDTCGPNRAELQSATMTCREVAKELSYGTAQVVALRRRGIFRTIGLARGPLMVPMFDRKEVLDVARDVRRRLDLNRAKSALGVPYYAIEQLCSLGLLPLLSHPYFEVRYSDPQIAKESLDKLVGRLLGGRTTFSDDARSIYHVMHAVGGRLKPWGGIIEAMLIGKLAYSIDDGDGPLFKRLRLGQGDPQFLHKVLTTVPRGGDGIGWTFAAATTITKSDAAEVLNLAVRQATALLACYPTTAEPIVPIADVVAVAQKLVTNTEIAARLDVAPQSVRSAARKLGIEQVSEAGYDRSREAEIVAVVSNLKKLGETATLRAGDHARSDRYQFHIERA